MNQLCYHHFTQLWKHTLYLLAFHLIIIEVHIIQKVVALFLWHISSISSCYDCNCCQSTGIFVYTKVIYSLI